MKAITEKQFFSLLRGGLWRDYTPDAAQFDSSTDWPTIYRVAKEQAVAAIVWDGMEKLPPGLMPDKPLKMAWYSLVAQTERANQLLNQKLVEIVGLYEAAGIHPILLKGQGLATLYPNPLHRLCGDIDLYVGKERYSEANSVALANGGCDMEESDHHSHLTYQGVFVENHRKMAVIFTKAAEKKFERLLASWYPSSPEMVTICNRGIMVPPGNFNAQYVFLHLYKHFIINGVGLRQLCDFALLLNSGSHRDIELIGYRRAWLLMGSVCVEYLGLPPDKMPQYRSGGSPDSRKVVEMILQEGNFGFNDKDIFTQRPKGYFGGKLFSFRHQFARWIKLLSVLPRDTIQYILAFKIADSLKLIIKERF